MCELFKNTLRCNKKYEKKLLADFSSFPQSVYEKYIFFMQTIQKLSWVRQRDLGEEILNFAAAKISLRFSMCGFFLIFT